jgi:hypothetical protein
MAREKGRDTYEYNAEKALKTVAQKLPYAQLAKYIYQYLPLLEKEEKEEKILGCRMISCLASHLHSCPDEITLQLITLADNNDRNISYSAIETLKSLKPNILLIQSGLINKLLANEYDSTFAYKCIIKLADVMSPADISDTLIYNLIRSQPRYDYEVDTTALKKQAISLLIKKLNETQLNTFVNYCLQERDHYPASLCLTSIPGYLLNDQLLEPLFKKHSALFKADDEDTRSRICQALTCYKPI